MTRIGQPHERPGRQWKGRKVIDGDRADAYPEHLRYEDDGCSVSPKCTECPLSMCRHEAPGGLRQILNVARDAEITKRSRAGVSAAQIATEFGVSKRTVFRVRSEWRDRTDTELSVLGMRKHPMVPRGDRDNADERQVQSDLPLWALRSSRRPNPSAHTTHRPGGDR